MNDRPNIVIFMTDQQRFDSLGCYGCDHIATPHLDRLASEGALFENCYVNATICTPSRASIWTGRPVPGHGVHKLHDVLPKDRVMFPYILQQNGYKTALIGKLHVSGHKEERETRHPYDGFDQYDWCPDPFIQADSPFNTYAAWLQEHHPAVANQFAREKKGTRNVPAQAHMSYWAAERTMQFLQDHDREQPFFCVMSLFDPHDPYHDYPLESLQSVRRDKLKPPSNVTLRPADVPEEVRKEQGKFIGRHTAEEIRAMQEGYYASIGFLDEQVGKVLATLTDLGYEDNTLVIFVSDHGDMMGDKDLLKKGAYFYDPCTKVPFLLKWPGSIPAGVRRQQLIQPHDMAATCLAAAGLDTTGMPHSCDLVPLAADGQLAGRDHAVTYYRNCIDWNPPLQGTMFRDDRYKLNVYHDTQSLSGAKTGELFDMAADPDETDNLWNSAEHQSIKWRLVMRLLDWTTAQEHAYRSGSPGM